MSEETEIIATSEGTTENVATVTVTYSQYIDMLFLDNMYRYQHTMQAAYAGKKIEDLGRPVVEGYTETINLENFKQLPDKELIHFCELIYLTMAYEGQDYSYPFNVGETTIQDDKIVGIDMEAPYYENAATGQRDYLAAWKDLPNYKTDENGEHWTLVKHLQMRNICHLGPSSLVGRIMMELARRLRDEVDKDKIYLKQTGDLITDLPELASEG